MKISLKAISLFLTILMFGAIVRASADDAPYVRHYGVVNGLSNSMVNDIAQDADGFIWIATNDGLSRFNGYGFSNYNTSNSGLTANELRALAVAPADRTGVWIGTQRNGICRYDIASGLIEKPVIAGLLSPDISDISIAGDGGLWITHYHFGPQHYNPVDGTVRSYDFESVKGLPRHCWASAEGKGGRLYVGHASHGFSVVDTVLHTCRNYTYDPTDNGLPGSTVYCVAVDRSGNAWLGTENGAAVYNSVTGEIIPFVHNAANPGSISPGRVRSISVRDDGTVLFATSQGGVSRLDTKNRPIGELREAVFEKISYGGEPHGTTGRNINSIFSDSYGNVWVGHYRAGVDVLDRIQPIFKRIEYLTPSDAAGRYMPVWSCTPDADGKGIWVGSEDEIAHITESKVVRYPLRNGVTDENHSSVTALFSSKGGTLLVGTSENGMFMFSERDGSFRRMEGSPKEILTFVKLPEGRVLSGTDDGIFEVEKNSLRPLTVHNSLLLDRMVTSMVTDKGGNLWVGTFGKGLYVFRPDATLRGVFEKSDGFISNAVNCLKVDSRGRIWAGTRNGVVVFESPLSDDSFKEIDLPSKHGVAQVMSIEEDRRHDLWLTTSKGVVRVDGTSYGNSYFSDSPYMPLNTFVENGSMADANGSLYFASHDGLITVDPLNAELTAAEPATVVTGVRVMNSDSGQDTERNIRPGDNLLSLSHNENSVVIIFGTLDHSMLSRTEYAYNMQGVDDVWIVADENHEAVFRNLAPGTYRFRVISRVSGGQWSAPRTLLTVKIAPPFYLTWWAILIYIFMTLGIVWGVVTLYKKRLDQRQVMAAELDNHRNSVKLNDERLQFYTNITHELRTPLTLILGPLEDMVSDPSLPRQYSFKLRMMRESSKALLNLIDGILEFRKTESSNRRLEVSKGNLGNLIREIALRFKELNNNDEVEVIIDISADDTPIYFDTEMITIILNNLLSNALKYTQKGYVKVAYRTIERDGVGYSEISVEDTGLGISEAGMDHIFERYYRDNGTASTTGTGIGLSLVKNLVELHQGTITVKSEKGRGSVFTVTLLTDNIYPDAIHSGNHKKADRTVDDGSHDHTVQPLKMLVVEDNDDIREYIRQALVDEFDVVTARNGLEGLHMVQSIHPDLIISDIMMPEMDGIELCRAVKEDILTSHVPVILLTAKDTLRDKEAGYESGADSYLTKPFSAKLLISRIHNLLRARRKMAYDMYNITRAGEVKQPSMQQKREDHNAETETAMNPLDRQFMEKILSVINENLALESLGVNLIADKMCMSSSTLYRKIMANVGVSTNEYIRHIRLSRAVEMLTEGKSSITDIAYATGFGSHSSFAKAFKKEFGMTATEYVANLKKKDEPTQ